MPSQCMHAELLSFCCSKQIPEPTMSEARPVYSSSPFLLSSSSSSKAGMCGMQGHNAPMHAHLSAPAPHALLPPMRPEVLLLGIFSLCLWLLGLISGLLLPLALQRLSWRRSGATDDSAAAGRSAPQSRPLSEIDSDEEDEVLLDSSHNSGLQHHHQLQLPAQGSAVTQHWQLSESDVQYYKSVVDPVKAKLLTGDLGPGWSFIMEKEQPGRMRYASYWRPTTDGKTDYLSITIVNGATAQEMHEFNMDDSSRVGWDPMLKSAWLLASGKDVSHTAEQLVVYLRSFPMGFVSDRLYAGISRREFTDPSEPGCFYTVSKVVHTPTTAAWAALNYPGVTMTDNYFSAWECRTILSPWASTEPEAQPACAIILLHHDDLKVPEYLARTAIKLGMWKFVQGMTTYADKFVRERRTRVDPFLPDPHAAGRQPAPALSPDVAAAAAAVAHRHAPPAAAALPAPAAGGVAAVEGGELQSAVPLVRTSRSLSGSPHNSWGGFQKKQQQQQQAADTPRILTHVPTAPAPLHLLAQDGSGAGLLVSGKGEFRRGHSMEWEPRVQSSSNNSSMAGDGSADAGSSGEANQQPGGAWPWLGAAARRPVDWGGAAGGAVMQLAHVPAAAWGWLHRVVLRGQQQSGQAGGQAGAAGSAAAAGRVAKDAGARFLAPAGPEDGEHTPEAAVAAAAAAVAAQQHAGSGGGRSPLTTADGTGSRAASLHSRTADFAGSSSSSSNSSRGARRDTVGKRLQRLLLGAAVAAAVGAGLAAHSRRKVVGAQPVPEESEVGQERKQQGRGLRAGL